MEDSILLKIVTLAKASLILAAAVDTRRYKVGSETVRIDGEIRPARKFLKPWTSAQAPEVEAVVSRRASSELEYQRGSSTTGIFRVCAAFATVAGLVLEAHGPYSKTAAPLANNAPATG